MGERAESGNRRNKEQSRVKYGRVPTIKLVAASSRSAVASRKNASIKKGVGKEEWKNQRKNKRNKRRTKRRIKGGGPRVRPRTKPRQKTIATSTTRSESRALYETSFPPPLLSPRGVLSTCVVRDFVAILILHRSHTVLSVPPPIQSIETRAATRTFLGIPFGGSRTTRGGVPRGKGSERLFLSSRRCRATSSLRKRHRGHCSSDSTLRTQLRFSEPEGINLHKIFSYQ